MSSYHLNVHYRRRKELTRLCSELLSMNVNKYFNRMIARSDNCCPTQNKSTLS